ncbi:MAG: DUF2752 domain-containing protein [Bacteroidales bacterium]|nr:DUF2752 domain-containing protein [Bacteroidales bacterium]
MTISRRIFKLSLLAAILLVLALVYYTLDPASSSIFPSCPFYYLTGYKCPGCGSQRAVHALLHLDFGKAMKANPLLVPSIPYIILGLLFDYTNLSDKYPKTRKILFGKIAIILVIIIVVSFGIIRNL